MLVLLFLIYKAENKSHQSEWLKIPTLLAMSFSGSLDGESQAWLFKIMCEAIHKYKIIGNFTTWPQKCKETGI